MTVNDACNKLRAQHGVGEGYGPAERAVDAGTIPLSQSGQQLQAVAPRPDALADTRRVITALNGLSAHG
ncbi:hypothetical protein [Streptomonospora salina]|uniref:Uncharacterized protein n=1 Tax=Streptomonospora salina TaxID=104205 RepID=A0A841EKQ4_9ACTN|nr:hypothetical protein [Streptomonospora salina]MBB5999991.1 hypothetical protein [Streptomonospora salina]